MKSLKIKDFFDEMNEGLIAIDESGVIIGYNAKAKQMLGAKRNCMWDHPGGTLNKGDIVIFAYTAFGEDEEGVDCKDLERFGIDLIDIEKGTSLLAVGQYDTQVKGKSRLKYPDQLPDQFVMQDEFLGVEFSSKIDYLERYVEIKVYGENYRYYFNKFFNHIVILDGKTKAFKFYQMGGYTLWNEDLKDLLSGKPFHEKIKGYQEKPIDRIHISNYHKEDEIIHDLLLCSRGENIGYSEKNGKINGITIRLTLNPIVRAGKIRGAYLLMNDISQIQIAENQRNMAYKKLVLVNAKLGDKEKYDQLFKTVIGSSKGMVEVKQLAYKASCFKSNVIILGESGTGKSILARAIHQVSEASDKPFIQVNVNSIPENLIESEMFGYEKGAFTGASSKGKKGYFELANQGTLFLDEIGELSNQMQVKLLQAIQNRSFFRVGGEKEINVDVRIIVATNKHLKKEIKEGRFREDLYYRINVFPIKQPPLRERIEDIYELVEYLLPKVCMNVGVKEKRLSAEGYEKLRQYTWPGNIRELENVLERAVNLCEESIIDEEYIKIKIIKRNYINKDFFSKPLKNVLLDTELDIIEQVVSYTDGDKEEAMKILDIKKTKFYDRLKMIKERRDSENTEIL